VELSHLLSRSLVVFTMLATGMATAALSETCAALRPNLRPAAASTLGIFGDARVPEKVLERAVAAWSSCSSDSRRFPTLSIGRGGTRNLFVHFDPTAIGPHERCGEFSGRTITLFARTRTDSGAVVGCGSLSQNLIHELGHAFGLADAPRSCSSFSMAKLNPRNRFHRHVQPAECSLLLERWLPLPQRSTSSRSHTERTARPVW